MSRIGRKPIVIPAGVEVKIDEAERTITVKGPKGTLHSKFHPLMTVAVEGNEILVTRPNDEKEARSLHGLTRTLIHNMVVGVTEGFRKDLEIQGVGYRAAKQGSKLTLTLKYQENGTPVIAGLKRVSKPGLRIYTNCEDMPKVMKGLGTAIISTSKGVMTDKAARAAHVGGEVLAFVW